MIASFSPRLASNNVVQNFARVLLIRQCAVLDMINRWKLPLCGSIASNSVSSEKMALIRIVKKARNLTAGTKATVDGALPISYI